MTVHGGMTILLGNMEIKDECFVYGQYMGITYNSHPQSYGESFQPVDDYYHLPINWIGKI